MTLSAGTRLGPYEILSPLGAGGMGEVYRTRDTRLGGQVTARVLPQSLAADPEALARFEREALAVAAHSHLNLPSTFDFGSELKQPLPRRPRRRSVPQLLRQLLREAHDTHRN
jgi:eukaryotic-like serine/threonine-protein kinase